VNIVAIELMLGLPPLPSLREKGVAHGSVVGHVANAGAARVALAQQPTCK